MWMIINVVDVKVEERCILHGFRVLPLESNPENINTIISLPRDCWPWRRLLYRHLAFVSSETHRHEMIWKVIKFLSLRDREALAKCCCWCPFGFAADRFSDTRRSCRSPPSSTHTISRWIRLYSWSCGESWSLSSTECGILAPLLSSQAYRLPRSNCCFKGCFWWMTHSGTEAWSPASSALPWRDHWKILPMSFPSCKQTSA